MKQQGINSSAFDSKFEALYSRYAARQQVIGNELSKNNIEFERVYPGTANLPFNFQKLYDDFQSYATGQFGTLGEPITIIVCAICVVAALIIGYGISNMIKPYYEEGKADLKISDDLLTALNTLPPDKKAAVVKDIETQIKTAYMGGKSDGSTGGILGTVKTFAFLGIGAFAAFKILPIITKKTQ